MSLTPRNYMAERLQWGGTGLSRPPLDFQPGNLLCWLDRLDSANSSRSHELCKEHTKHVTLFFVTA